MTAATDNSANLRPFDSERAKAAAEKSAVVRRRKAREKREIEAVQRQDVRGWVRTYEREMLGDAAAAAAQKIAHMVLNEEITDQRALVAALPVLFDIARVEAGQASSVTLHATMSSSDSMLRLQTIRAQALGSGPVDTTSSPPS